MGSGSVMKQLFSKKFSKKYILSLLFIFLAIISGIIFANHQITPTDYQDYHSSLLEKMEYAKTFSDFTDALFCYEVTSDTITTAYTLKNPSQYDIPALPATLSTFSYNQYDKNKSEKTEEALFTLLSNQLSQYSKTSLSEKDQITYSLLEKYFDLSKQLCGYPYYEELLGATTGVQANLPVTLGEYPLRSEEDVQTYLALLRQIPTYFDNVILYEKHRQEIGYTTADFMLNDTLDGLSTLTDSLKENDNCFTETFESRIAAIENLDKEQANQYCQQNKEDVEKYILPSYEKLQGFVENLLANCDDSSSSSTSADNSSLSSSTELSADSSDENSSSDTTSLSQSSSRNSAYIPESNTAYGLSTLPEGRDYYALLVKSNTGSERSVEELISMTELALKSALGNVLNIAVTDSQAYLYYCDNTLPSYYEQPESILEALSLLSREQYPVLASAPTYTIKSVPDSLAAHLSPAFYMIPAMDDFDHNTIYINQLYTSAENGNLFTTLAHEGFPGHLYQTVYFNSTNPAPIRQVLNYPGYVEGWATYVEMNAFHYVDYPLDSESLCTLYQSDTIISLALSSRVDLGVNYENWTLNDVNQFFEDSGFQSYYAADLYAYVVEAPAVYLRYFIGYLEIEDLKQQYQNQEMENFSEKEFHRLLLEIGPADFGTIEECLME
jgi:uncharacterized protein (DUF885 family)